MIDHLSIYLLNNFSKSETNAVVLRANFWHYLGGKHVRYTQMDPKRPNGTPVAAVSCDMIKSLQITSHASIFTAELVALNLVLDII